MSLHFVPSAMSTSDLDGWSPQQIDNEFTYPMAPEENDEFGFDPAPKMHNFSNQHQSHDSMFTPPDNLDFDFDPAPHPMSYPIKYESRALPLSHVVPTGSASGASVSRYGQVTPPRSNSESSIGKVEEKPTRQRRNTKGSIKEEATKATQSGRKRRNTRKNSLVVTGDPDDDDKRKQSLEKNRLAAAKCRINKKEKTEQLQRDSHEMAMTNAYLKDTVMRMKEEVQQMNALLLSHAKCEGCKSPEEISKHLNDLGNEFLAARMHINHEPFSIPDMSLDSQSEMDHENYFSPASEVSMMNPPLPEFNREGTFDVTTPMKLD